MKVSTLGIWHSASTCLAGRQLAFRFCHFSRAGSLPV